MLLAARRWCVAVLRPVFLLTLNRVRSQRKAQGLDCALFQVEGGVVYVETGGVDSTLPVLMRYCV